ncbi:MAG: hypothetical protein ACR2NN_23100 [Bryobacteraceae bacterium]
MRKTTLPNVITIPTIRYCTTIRGSDADSKVIIVDVRLDTEIALRGEIRQNNP